MGIACVAVILFSVLLYFTNLDTFVFSHPEKDWLHKKINRDFTAVMFDPHIRFSDSDIDQPYNEQELVHIVSVIQTRFSIIVVQIKNLDQNECKHPTLQAAAAFNNDAKSMSSSRLKQVEVWAFMPYQILDDPKGLECFYNAIRGANIIFPRTVAGVIFQFIPNFNTNKFQTAKKQLQREWLVGEGPIKVGIYLGWKPTTAIGKQIQTRTFPRSADVVFLAVRPNKTEIENPDSSFNRKFTNKLHTIKKNLIKDGLNDETQVGFITQWPDTTNSGNVNYDNLVQFWMSISAWAGNHQVPVIFKSAFDLPDYNDDVEDYFKSTSGWWRLEENGLYNSTEEYVFIEKQSLRGTFYNQNHRKNTTLLFPTRNCPFSNNVVLEYQPFTLEKWTHNDITAEALSPQIYRISQKFRRVMVDATSSCSNSSGQVDTNSLPSRIQKVLSEIHKQQLKINGLIPIEIFVLFLNLSDNLKLADYQITCLIDEANFIKPNTTTTLILNFPSGFDSKYNAVLARSRYLGYGVVLPLHYCNGPVNGTRFRKHFDHIITSDVPLILLKQTVSPKQIKHGPEKMCKQLSAAVEECDRKVQAKGLYEKGRIIKVGLLTSWPVKDDNGLENIAQMVNYWELFNQWADRTNTMVVFSQAFDVPSKLSDNTSGWWTLKDGVKCHTLADCDFVEKKSVINPRTQFKSSPDSLQCNRVLEFPVNRTFQDSNETVLKKEIKEENAVTTETGENRKWAVVIAIGILLTIIRAGILALLLVLLKKHFSVPRDSINASQSPSEETQPQQKGDSVEMSLMESEHRTEHVTQEDPKGYVPEQCSNRRRSTAVLSTLIVGSDECSFQTITDILLQHDMCAIIMDKCNRFAKTLGIASVDTFEIKRRCSNSNDVITEVLNHWRLKEGEGATLSLLITHLEAMEWQNILDRLVSHFIPEESRDDSLAGMT